MKSYWGYPGIWVAYAVVLFFIIVTIFFASSEFQKDDTPQNAILIAISDECKVYRFYDKKSYHYFWNCKRINNVE
jgi:uncharacterized protein (UPF0333 family)